MVHTDAASRNGQSVWRVRTAARRGRQSGDRRRPPIAAWLFGHTHWSSQQVFNIESGRIKARCQTHPNPRACSGSIEGLSDIFTPRDLAWLQGLDRGEYPVRPAKLERRIITGKEVLVASNQLGYMHFKEYDQPNPNPNANPRPRPRPRPTPNPNGIHALPGVRALALQSLHDSRSRCQQCLSCPLKCIQQTLALTSWLRPWGGTPKAS